jgi:hypothetical protein
VSVTTTFLRPRPQKEIASAIRAGLTACRTAQIVSGFATPDGVKALRAEAFSHKITNFVLGAGTFKAFEALDGLISSGLPSGSARVHLGHTRASRGKKHPFARYRPMLHSKIYFFEMPDGTATAFVGSHNLTGFALRGLNGEAGIMLNGPSSDIVFNDIRSHISESYRQAVPYDSSLKEAYALWLRDYLDQLGIDATDMPRDDEKRQTVVLFAKQPFGRTPAVGERIYFELDQRITSVNAINTEVHLHLFAQLPANPTEALARSGSSDFALLGKVEAIDSGSGSAEIKADWYIDDPSTPELKRATSPFRPLLTPGKQQVRAEVTETIGNSFDYLFDSGRGNWKPVLGNETVVDDETADRWTSVSGLSETSPLQGDELLMIGNVKEISPSSGSFVLFSPRRRKLGKRE